MGPLTHHLKTFALLFTILLVIQCPVSAIVHNDGSIKRDQPSQEIEYNIAIEGGTPTQKLDDISRNIKNQAQSRLKIINGNVVDSLNTNQNTDTAHSKNSEWTHIKHTENIQKAETADAFAYNNPISKSDILSAKTQNKIIDGIVQKTITTTNQQNPKSQPETSSNYYSTWWNDLGIAWKIAIIVLAIILVIVIAIGIIRCCMNYDTSPPTQARELTQAQAQALALEQELARTQAQIRYLEQARELTQAQALALEQELARTHTRERALEQALEQELAQELAQERAPPI